jgi:hypothetical protein
MTEEQHPWACALEVEPLYGEAHPCTLVCGGRKACRLAAGAANYHMTCMKNDPFHSPRWKLRHARRLIEQLAAEWRKLGPALPIEKYHVSVGNGRMQCRARVQEGVSEGLGCSVADIITTLRNSLDQMVQASARAVGLGGKRNAFPFSETAIEWEKARKHQMKTSDDRTVAIARSLSPWRAGNQVLYAIHKLSIQDKHYALLELPVAPRKARWTVTAVPDAATFIMPEWDRSGGFAPLYEYPVIAMPTIPDVEIDVDLLFGAQLDLVEARPVIPVLEQMLAECEKALATFVQGR